MSPRERTGRSGLVIDVFWFVVTATLLTLIMFRIDAVRDPADAAVRGLDGLGVGIILVASAGVAMLRRSPLPGLSVITSALVVYSLLEYPGGPVYVTAGVGLYRVASTSPRRVGWTAGAIVISAVIGSALIVGRADPDIHLLFAGWTIAAVFLGDAVRSRREHLAGVEARVQESREEEGRRRVAEERLRIARDLHDGVAHSMATINVQAGVAAHVIDRQPDKAKEALEVIRRSSGEVLDELGAMLRLLRDGAGEAAGDVTPPTPGLAQLGSLVDSARRTGLRIELREEGKPEGVPHPVDVAAYRIVQESLTNVARHAGSASVVVTVDSRRGVGLTVEVVDDGGGATVVSNGAGSGVGIVGMRERAEATGGTLYSGPRLGGGFRVRAAWPQRP